MALTRERRRKIVKGLGEGEKPSTLAKKNHCSARTVEIIAKNLREGKWTEEEAIAGARLTTPAAIQNATETTLRQSQVRTALAGEAEAQANARLAAEAASNASRMGRMLEPASERIAEALRLGAEPNRTQVDLAKWVWEKYGPKEEKQEAAPIENPLAGLTPEQIRTFADHAYRNIERDANHPDAGATDGIGAAGAA